EGREGRHPDGRRSPGGRIPDERRRTNMSKSASWGTAVVAAHAVVSAVHGVAHAQVGVAIFPSLFHLVMIVGVITLAPVAAAVLLWTPFRRAGAWLLVASMAASLLFGVFYHYSAAGPDHVSQIPQGNWGMLFHVTAALLAVTEVLGCGVGLGALIRRPRNASL